MTLLLWLLGLLAGGVLLLAGLGVIGYLCLPALVRWWEAWQQKGQE